MARPTSREQILKLLKSVGVGVRLETIRTTFPGPATDAALLDLIDSGTVDLLRPSTRRGGFMVEYNWDGLESSK